MAKVDPVEHDANTADQLVALVVDDAEFIRKKLDRVLSRCGFDVRLASGGREALKLATADQPHVILLDVQMPDMDGFAVCEKLKAEPATRHIPVIFVTGSTKADQTIHGFEVGGADYISKSSSDREVAARARVHARIAQLQGELLKGRDELAARADALAKSKAELHAMHEKLMESSRRAGMAEVATGVLHNVGNALNSVNVSASVVADKLRKSKVSSLAKVVGLMREHEHDLGAFFTEDDKGKKLPAYLVKLARHLAEEQSSVIGELESLTKNIEHIKKIVTAQQSHAGSFGVIEFTSITDVIDDALSVNTSSFERYDIEMVREYADLPQIALDKQKLLQIMVNLVRNAKHAVLDGDNDDKRLTLRIARHGEARVRIEVIDNGVGIAADNLTKIFSHGFTTKSDGHGFGLHSSALAAKEMGGSLSAHSDGPGKGATFTLELPLKPAEVTV